MSAKNEAVLLQQSAKLLQAYTVEEIEYALIKLPCRQEKCLKTFLDCNNYVKQLFHFEQESKKMVEILQLRDAEKAKMAAEIGKLSDQNQSLRAQNENLTRENEQERQKNELIRRKRQCPSPSQGGQQSPSPPDPSTSSATLTPTAINSNKSPATVKQWTWKIPKKRRPSEGNCVQMQETGNASTSISPNETVTVSKNNEKEEKQEANLVQNSAIHILAAAVGENEKKNDLEMDMEIDDDANTSDNENVHHGDLANCSDKIAATVDGNLAPVESGPDAAEDHPVKFGPTTSAMSPTGTATPMTEADDRDSGIMENGNDKNDDEGEGDDADRTSSPPEPAAIKIIQEFRQWFTPFIAPINTGTYSLDVAINLFASYNPSIKKEMANPDPQHMEMIKENLRNFAIGILEAAKKMRATTA